MSASPEMDYLQADFDPNSLTMPKLRSILVEHDIHYGSAVKKSQLVDLFEENVRPKARQLLGARSRTKRSARGIVDVPSSVEPSLDGQISDEGELPARTPQRGSRRTTSRLGTEEATPAPPSTTRGPGRPSARAVRPSVESDASDGMRKSSGVRKTRLSSATPTVKIEEEDEAEVPAGRRRQSGFTSENVFQSGSSPTREPEPSRDRRRRTTGGATTEVKKRSTSRRQVDDTAASGQVTAPLGRPRPYTSRAAPSIEKNEDEKEDMDAGEEFTAEEEQELALQEQQNGAIVPSARRKAARPGAIGKLLRTAPKAIGGLIVTLIPVYLGFLRQEKLAVGFCGVGRPAITEVGDYPIPAWAQETLLPTCEPCPPHAYCHSNLEVQCEEDFVRSPHPLSLGGLVPMVPSCEPDGEKARKVQAVAQRAVEELRERNAKVECGELKDETTGKKITSADIPEPELKATVSSKRHRRFSDSEFEELWHSALPDIMGRDEVIGDIDPSNPTRRTLRSTSLARVPLSCAIRRSIRVALVRYLKELIGSLILISGLYYAYASLLSYWEMESRAKQLAAFAIDSIQTQAAWANYYGDEPADDGGRVERYVGVAQLRDDVLRDEFSAKRRQALWKRVQFKVEDNTNVRSAVRESQSGEVGRTWEWIGAVGAIEFGDGSLGDGSGSRPASAGGLRRRKSGRFSLPARFADASPAGARSEDATPRAQELRHWEESRPVY